MATKLTYIDLFAGAGGLSEGFHEEGFEAIAHVEMSAHACNTIRTRTAYHYLKEKGDLEPYYQYIKAAETNSATAQEDFYNKIPENLLNKTINKAISEDTIQEIFDDIDFLLADREVDVIVGGPPCQAYSTVGRARDKNRMVGDKRNYLFKYYAEFLKRYAPKYFVFENVQGLLSAGKGQYYKEMQALFESEEVGYKIQKKLLHANDYGVLQNRKRIIIIGKRIKDLEPGQSFDFPNLPVVENNWGVLNDLFSDLPVLNPGEGVILSKYKKKATDYLKESKIRTIEPFLLQHICRPHNPRDLEIYKIAINRWLDKGERLKYNEVPAELATHANKKSFLDRFKVVNHKGNSHTVVAHIAKDGHYYIYPSKKQIRSISIREAARLQSFPDNYYFEGGRSAAFRQIGNAVPPLMAKTIANTIKKFLND